MKQEEDLEKSFGLLFGKSDVCALAVDEHGLILDVNPAAENLFGAKKIHLTTQTFSRAIKSSMSADIAIFNSQTGLHSACIHSTPFNWNKRKAALVFIRDIQNRIKASVIKSEPPLVVHFFGTAIYCKNKEGIILSWSSSAQKLFGYSEGHVQGKCSSALMPDGSNKEVKRILQKVWKGETLKQIPAQIKCKDHTVMNILISAAPVFDEQGKVEACLFAADRRSQPRPVKKG